MKIQITRVLIIDDQPDIIELFIAALSEMEYNFKFYKALNGKVGVEIANEIIPDLIIIDWEMPVMNGIEAILELKKNGETATIPIVVSTGVMTSSHNLRAAFEAGAIDFIKKPVDTIELQARIKSVLMLIDFNRKIIEQKEQILQNKAEELQLELDFRSKELTSNALFITKNNQKNEQLLTRVKKLYPYLNKTGNKELDNIIKEFSSDISHQFWLDFEMHFEEIHPGFFKHLLDRYPDLSPNEKRLCAFIKLNMNTKDIAEITYQNPQSINVARSRLRNRLRLDREENLVSFLQLL